MQGFAAGLGIKEKITSPTFNIFKKYPIKNEPGSYEPGSFYHFDCYRIEKPKEILDLGFEKIISDPKNIVAIEWAENIKESLPKNTRWINFKFVDKNTRVIDIS
ncbi:MAG: tRNA (adenosine(37)-N6)-threonylcarbamoyltransferase complex ATPase subunit type 1 TsaE [Candidatus Nealsonbacteria bacterium RIFOXYC1_FULL_40_7]|nr:MAG: tRNA (adenosine(37)-N6)-threonylcarbamoyltransferase complex ATPase subunit type 1 TsaE [Candidatus Nealsonbacteria bacterium RIFOXYC1_FULL_40_7]